jgi:hypothetical protein
LTSLDPVSGHYGRDNAGVIVTRFYLLKSFGGMVAAALATQKLHDGITFNRLLRNPTRQPRDKMLKYLAKE